MTQAQTPEKNPEFATHMLNDDGIYKAKHIQEIFDVCLNSLTPLCSGSGRELSIVKTKLEEASFFAKKAMAKLERNQQGKAS